MNDPSRGDLQIDLYLSLFWEPTQGVKHYLIFLLPIFLTTAGEVSWAKKG